MRRFAWISLAVTLLTIALAMLAASVWAFQSGAVTLGGLGLIASAWVICCVAVGAS